MASWSDSAACRDKPVSLFFPPMSARGEPFTAQGKTDTAAAKLVCGSCDVLDECRAEHPTETYGIWWGTTPKERRSIQRRAANHQTSLNAKQCANPACTQTFQPARDRQVCCSRDCAWAFTAHQRRSPYTYHLNRRRETA